MIRFAELWSNVAYLIAGGIVLFDAPVIGLALLTVSILSALFHAAQTPETRKLDRFGVLVLVLALVAHFVWPLWASMLLLPGAWLLAQSLKPIDPVVGAGFGLVIGKTLPDSLLAAGIFLVAVAVAAYAEQYEESRDVRYQVAHAIWHTLSAMAIVTLLM